MLLLELEVREPRVLLRVAGTPLGVEVGTKDLLEFLLLLGVVLLQLLEVNFGIFHRRAATLAIGTHSGTATGAVTSGAHASARTTHTGTTTLTHTALRSTGTALTLTGFRTGSVAASLEVLTAILDVFLVELGEFLDLFGGQGKLGGHFIYAELGFLFYGELGFLAMMLTLVLSGLLSGRLCCCADADGKAGSD